MPTGGFFFEPAPPPREPPQRHWSAPAWDRPSEGTVPWLLPVNAVVHRSEDAVVWVESIAVYPNGFLVNVRLLVDPHRSPMELRGPMMRRGARAPRVGVRFADGRTAGQEAGMAGGWIGATPTSVGIGPAPQQGPAKDVNGFPTTPIARPVGGGGGSHGWRFGVWVYPLPPEGPLEVFVSMPVVGLDEGKIEVDGGEVRAAAARAIIVWE